MAKKIPIPSDFRKLAPVSSTSELAKAYGRSTKTIQNWRRECGIPPPPRTGTPIENGKYKGMDTPEQIQYCLRCPVNGTCYGLKCPLLPKARKRKQEDDEGRTT